MISKRDVERWFESGHFRKKSAWIVIDQPKVIHAWQDSSKIVQIMVDQTDKIPKKWGGVEWMEVSHQWLSKLTNKPTHSGILVIVNRPKKNIEQLKQAKRVLLLDGIQDPGNMGTIIRSAVAFGVNTICVTKDCVDVFHPKSINASSGTIGSVSIFDQSDWGKWIQTSKLPCIVLSPHANISLQSVNKHEGFILISGSEGQGVQSEEIQQLPAKLVAIPMNKQCESLNVAMSVSIALYELVHRV